MQKIVFIIALILHSLVLFASENIIDEVDSLIDERQYEKAFMMLETNDPGNDSIDFVLRKAELAYEYYSKTVMHQYFIFTNLEGDMTLDSLRAEEMEGDYKLFYFPFNDILAEKLLDYPEEFELHKWLGLFYYLIYDLYEEEWLIPADNIIELAKHHLQVYAGVSEKPFKYSGKLGFVYLLSGEFTTSIYWIDEALKREPENPELWYNKASANFYMERFDLISENALRSARYQDDPFFKADAYRMAGIGFFQMNQLNEALEVLQKANDIFPGFHLTEIQLLETKLLLNQNRRAFRLANDMFAANYSEPQVTNDILQAFLKVEEYRRLNRFFRRNKRVHRRNDEALGNLYFHEARFNLHKEDRTEALKNFKTSRTYFEKSVDEYHYVFDIIDEAIRQIENLQ
ncbi:MAG: hypothetical protein EA412_05755 [Chitinophagaceae bacterium]|nr:MAG: hypothetical protein EA412_05755 [Chitinophagaceae bacterium]